jgi:hypothetical protein
LKKEEVIMRSLIRIFSAMVLMVSFCFVLSGLAQETKEPEGLYTIKKGDTLWDISSKFLKDPFLWPKLWERNPYITNPHWIYPGNPIRLSATEPTKTEEPKKVVEEKPKEVIKEPEVTKPEVAKAEPPPVEKKPEEVAEAKPVKVEEKPLYFPEIRSAGFMSDIEYRGIGIILESKEGKNIMSAGDILYLAFRTSEAILIGNKYTVFRASDEIRHPLTEKKIGRKYNIKGNIQIIDQHGNFFVAKVIESFEEIKKGDFIQPYSKEKMEGLQGNN